MRILLVTNPKAGSAGGVSTDDLADALRPAGAVTLLEVSDRDKLVTEAAGFDAVVVAGGDGSLHHALNVLSARVGAITWGLVPMGTGNDLARTLGLPEDPLEAAGAIATGTTRSLDLGRVVAAAGERLFINACMGGFSVRADEAVDEEDKERLGPLAFWWGGIKAATDIERTLVTVNGAEVPDCIAVGVGNGRTCGGGIEVWPDASPSDGMLDVAVLPAASNVDAFRLALKVRKGSHREIDEVLYQRAAEIVVESADPVPFNVDGEVLGFATPLRFEIAGSINMMTPGR